MLRVHIDAGAHMATKSGWAAFPHDAKGYAYAGDALKKAWPKLHAGDCEPYPDEADVAAPRAGGEEKHPNEPREDKPRQPRSNWVHDQLPVSWNGRRARRHHVLGHFP